MNRCSCPCHSDDADGRQNCTVCSEEDTLLAKEFEKLQAKDRRVRDILMALLAVEWGTGE